MTKRKKISLILVSLGLAVILAVAAIIFFLYRSKPGLVTDKEEVSLFVGESSLLHVISDTDKEIIWTSENENIATVYHGLVKAVDVGETTVTVEAEGFAAKEVTVVVVPGVLEGYQDVVTYVGEPPVDISLQDVSDYTYQVERYDSGDYTAREDLVQDNMLSTKEAGTYRITYALEETKYVRHVRVNPLRELSDFAVLEAFDGFVPVKTAAIQFSEPEIDVRGSESRTEYITYRDKEKEELHNSLRESGYDGYLDNNTVARVERQFARNSYYGSYIYLDITPELKTFFDKMDEFDEEACLSLWYRVTVDVEGKGDFQPADVTYNYLVIENAENTFFSENYYNKAVTGSESGWMNFKIDFSKCTELVGAKRVLIAIGRWGLGGAGRIRCDFYSLETESLLLDAALGKKKMEYKWGDSVPYLFPSFSMIDLDQNDFQIYDKKGNQMTEGEEADYQKKKYNKRKWIMDLPIGAYEFRYALKGTGLKVDEDGTYKVKIPVTIQNPSLAGVLSNGELYYYTSYMYEGCIDSPNTSPVQKANAWELNDADYRALLEAGYAGAIEGKTCHSIQIGTEMKADNQARSIGMIFPGTTDGKLKKLLENERIINNYHVSVWVRIRNEAEQSCSSKVWAAVYNKNAKQQRNSMMNGAVWNEEYAFPNNQWVELKIPAAAIVGAYREFDGAFPGAAEEAFGISLPWLMVAGNEFLSPVNVDVFGAELCYNDISIKIGEKADVKADPVLYYEEAEVGFELYQDGRKLAKGKDYQVEAQTVVSGLSDGVYVIEYTGLNGILRFKRKIYVEPRQKVLNTVLAENGIRYYSSHDYLGSINTEHTNPVRDTSLETLSEDAWQDLLTAGYCGKLSERKVSRISIDMGEKKNNNAARTLGILFAEADSENLKYYVENEKACEDYYVSVWAKANYKTRFHAAAMVLDSASRSQANNTTYENIAVVMEEDEWTEIQIPLKYVRDAYHNFHAWYGNTASEAVPGIWVDWLMMKDGDAYPEDLLFTLDIYGAEIKYSGIEVKPYQSTDISIVTDMIRPGLAYTFEVIGPDGVLAAGKDYRMAGNRIIFEKAGDYGIKYNVVTPKELYQTDFVLYRPVHVQRAKTVPEMTLGEAGWYFAGHTYGNGAIDGPTTKVGETTQYTLTDEEYASLPAGAVSEERTVRRITINMDEKQEGNAARSVGILFEDTLNEELKSLAKNQGVQKEYYVSVWVRFSGASKVGSTYAIVADRAKKIQAAALPAMSFPEFEKETWTELRIPMPFVKKAYDNFSGWGCYDKGAQEDVFGIWFDWLCDPTAVEGDAYPDGTVLTIDIGDARVMYQGVCIQETKTADISVNTNILKHGMNYSYEIYNGDKLLQAGVDYTADGNRVVFEKAGVYTVKYVVQTTRDEYQTDFSFFRYLTITPRKQVPSISLGEAGSYFTSHNYQGAIDSPCANVGKTAQHTLTDEEYAGLPAGAATGDHRTANRITINMDEKREGNAARSVGILFPDTLNGQLKALAQDTDVLENCYVSVWVRFSETSKVGNTYAIVTDRAKRMQATAFPTLSFPTFEKATWTELRIPMSSVKTAYDNFSGWDNCQGAEEDVFGIWFDWLLNPMAAEGDAYPDGTVLTIDIYGAELQYKDIIVGKENTPVDLTVPVNFLGAGTETAYEIYRDGKLLTAGTEYTVEENQVVFHNPGDYMVKYRLTNREYAGTLCISRNVKIFPGIGWARSYFAGHTYGNGAIDGPTTKVGETAQHTLTEEEYAGLPAGAATGDRTANRITINMDEKQEGNAARSVGILFPDTMNGQLKAFAQDTNVQKNCYVSVWVRFSETSKVGNTYAIVTDRVKRMQAAAFPALFFPTFEKATWTELRIPMSSVKAGYDNFATWGNCQGAEEAVFGIWFDWLMYPEVAGGAYPDGTVLTIDIYGAQIVEN